MTSFFSFLLSKTDPKRIRQSFELILLIFAAFLPFLPALNPAPGIDLASSRVIILFVFLVWGGWLLLRKELPLLSFSGALILLFIAAASVSLLSADRPLWGVRKILVFLSVSPLFFVVGYVAKERRFMRKLIFSLIFSAVVLASMGILQYVGQYVFGVDRVSAFMGRITPFFNGEDTARVVIANKSWLVGIGGDTYFRAIGLFPDPHGFAFYLGMTLPFVVSFYLFSKKSSLLPFLCYAVLAFALLVSFSRGAYLAFFLSLFTVFLLAWHFAPRIKIAFLAASLVLFALLASGWVHVPAARIVGTRLESTFDLREGSNMGRLALWGKALGTIKEQPLTGVGIGNFPLFVDPDIPYRSPINTHNTYLDVWVEMGIPALGIWLLLVFGSIARLLRYAWGKTRIATNTNTNNHEINNFIFPIGVGLIGSLVYFAVHSFFEVSIYSPIILPLLMIVLALSASIIGTTNIKIRNQNQTRNPKPEIRMKPE